MQGCATGLKANITISERQIHSLEMALHYVVYSDKQSNASTRPQNRSVLILLHGGALSSRMHRTLIPHLHGQAFDTILTPDLPGHGGSKDLGPFTFTRSTQLLHDLLSNLNQDDLYKNRKTLLVGVSLGGQAALDLLIHQPTDIDAALISGASVHPPDSTAQWDMPRMPTDDAKWMSVIMEDVNILGMENAPELQKESFAFAFEPAEGVPLPPVRVVVGKHDTAMARRDAPGLAEMLRKRNRRSDMKVMEGAWHNHPIDVPGRFAEVIGEWDRECLT